MFNIGIEVKEVQNISLQDLAVKLMGPEKLSRFSCESFKAMLQKAFQDIVASSLVGLLGQSAATEQAEEPSSAAV